MTDEINKSESPINHFNTSVHQQIPALSDDLSSPLPGWPALAKIIAERPSLESFQTFRELRVKSLLYYQAELDMLRKELRAVEFHDFQTGEKREIEDASKFGTDLEYLFASRDNKDPKLSRQWTLIERIRDVLKEYGMSALL
jgi:hypothetical protein